MKTEDFILRVRRTYLLQSMTVTFEKKTGNIGLSRLYGYVTEGKIRLANENDMVTFSCVIPTGDWGRLNRSIGFYGLCALDDGTLAELARDIESIAVADHGAKGIMSARNKMRDEAAAKIIAVVLTSAFVKEIEGWGFQVAGQLLGWHGIPCIAFTFSIGSEAPLSTILLDGWSGRMAVQGVLGNEMYVKPEQLQKLIREAAEAKAEALTSKVAS